EVETAIVGGMMETVVNQGIELASGEESTLNIAGSVAPAGGLVDKAGDLVEVLLGNKSFVELTAATSAMGRIHDTFKTFNAINQFTALDNDRALLSNIENFASMTSGYSQALRARAAMRLGVHVSNAGSPTVQASYTSALAERLFGIQQSEGEEYHATRNEFSNEMKNTTGLFDKYKYTSQQAAALYEQVRRVVTLFNDEFDPDIEAEDTDVLSKLHLQRMRAGMQMHGEILALYDGVERDRIWQKFTNIA
ncbi:MAG: hypothetical protein GY814_20845, partial [Gammaproteobacteria bacterium]|nr:hypothetical protein [Gammaproteobacteria bacterium]